MKRQEHDDPLAGKIYQPVISSPNDAGYIFRKMLPEEMDRIREIDRSERLLESYIYEQGTLVLVPNEQVVQGFSEEESTAIIARQQDLIAAGGIVVGAFDSNRLIGVASVEKKRRGRLLHYCKMDILYISRLYRGKHIGIQLLDITKKIALDFGALKLYISATPTKYTVDFYRSQGARITTEIEETLFALEPDDIHLELPL